ncbi:MAG: ABC transporter permease [Acidobacteriota bacterium]
MANPVAQAWRTVSRMPLVASVVIVSLAVGIGVNTTVFSWIQTFVWNPLPGVDRAGAFLLVEPRTEAGGHPGASWREYLDLRERLRAIPDPVAFRMTPLNVGEPARTERAYALLVSGNYFRALGLEPAAGRFLRDDEAARPGGEPVAVISYDYWRTRFGGRADALGAELLLNGARVTVVGVAPDRFQGTVLGLQFDLWLPATMAPLVLAGSRELDDRSLRGYTVMGRPAGGASAVQAQAELDAAMRDLARLYPASNAAMTGRVLPFWRAPRGPQGMLLGALVALQGIMLVLLLAVCGNTANLLLAHATTRQREVGVRLAIGASPSQVMRLLLAEALTLAIPGALCGVLLAVWGTTALRRMTLSMAFPIRFQTGIDPWALAFALALGVGAALVFGLAPALQLARVDPLRALRAGSRTATRHALRSALMTAQVCLALIVLMVAGLFLQGVQETRDIDPGFRRDGILLAAYDLTGRGVSDADARTFAARLLQAIAALPEVDSVAIAASVPLDIHGLPQRAFALEGASRSDGALDRAVTNLVTPDYFDTMGMALLDGPGFSALDDEAAPPEVVVNQAFVDRYVPADVVIGRRMQVRDRTYLVVGVVATTVSEAFGEPPTPAIYFSYRDRPAAAGEIHVRTRAGSEMLIAPGIRRAVRELDRSLPLYNVRTMTEHVETNLFLRRIPARMFIALGPFILALAAIGVYAVVAYAVSNRTAEIGVRLALGATRAGVIRQIVRENLRLIVAGATVAWIGMWGVNAHLVRRPLDPVVFGAVPLMLVAVAVLASWVPARRAARVDPSDALRQE